MRRGFPIYDTHTHLGMARHSGRHFPAERLVAWMDEAQVEKAVVIPFPVVEDFRAAHQEIARAMLHYPGRLRGAACLNPYLPEHDFREEVKRCAHDLGFRALKLQPQYQALDPLSPRSDFFWETAQEFDMTVIVHTGAGAPFALPSLYIHPARRYPELRFVLAHGGGGIYAGEAIVAAEVCPNIYLELSTLMPHQIDAVLRHVSPQRLMIGSDLPENGETEFTKILSLPVEDAVKRDILWNTAERVFG